MGLACSAPTVPFTAEAGMDDRSPATAAITKNAANQLYEGRIQMSEFSEVPNEEQTTNNESGENLSREVNGCPQLPRPQQPRGDERSNNNGSDYIYVPPIFTGPVSSLQAQGEIRIAAPLNGVRSQTANRPESLIDAQGTIRTSNEIARAPSMRAGV